MSDWPEYQLGSFVDPDRSICYGIVQPGTPQEHGVPIIRVNNFKDGRLDTRDVLKVKSETEEKYHRSRLKGGELLVTLVGTIGLTSIVPRELRGWNVARAVGVIPLRDGVDKRWVNFVLRSEPSQAFIQTHANTTVQATFNLRDLARLPVPMPPDEIRLPASELLSALDDKIELNRRMNETLEEMAKTLFKDWFVDFGPTRAKMEGREPYLAPELWELFPDRLDDDGKPEGWALGTIQDLLDLAYGKSLPAARRIPGRFPVYGSGGIGGYHNEALVRGPAVIVGRKGTVGSLFWEDRSCFPIDTVFYVVPKSAPLTFCYHLLQHQKLGDMNTDAAVPGLNRNNVYRLIAPVPPSEIVVQFDALATALRDRIRANNDEARTLAETRDLLLPKLMSGELRVKDAEKAVEAVV